MTQGNYPGQQPGTPGYGEGNQGYGPSAGTTGRWRRRAGRVRRPRPTRTALPSRREDTIGVVG